MTDASITDIPRVARTSGPKAMPLPRPQPFGAPLLISDCASPLGGDTVLGLLLKRMMRADGDD
jgi:hypothetical protein